MAKKKQSGERVTELASAIMRGYVPTIEEVRSLAASVLAQRETPMNEERDWEARAPKFVNDEVKKTSWWWPWGGPR